VCCFLNVNTNGANYLAGVTDKGKTIDWYLCVDDELSELLNSTPWKHWKEGKFDYKNIFTENVDIYHFLLSIFLEDMYNGLSQSGVDTETVITEASKYERFGFIHFCQLFTVIVAIESAQGDEQALDKLLLDLAKYYKKNNSNHAENTVLIVMTFVLLSIAHPAINKSTDDFIKKYYAKNTLNQFRQDNGYGEDNGGYIKIWNGLEDNVVLDKIIETVEVTDVIELDAVIYELLAIEYRKVKK
jgi:dimeric dUTPase (all-alpha-NTP-PPase superfamily)